MKTPSIAISALLAAFAQSAYAVEPIYSETFDGITSDGCAVLGTMSAPFDSGPTAATWGTFNVGFGGDGCAGTPIGFQKVAGIGGQSGLRHDDLQRANSGSLEVHVIDQVLTANEFWWTMAVRVEDGGGVTDGDFLVLPTLYTPISYRQVFDTRLEADSVAGDRLVIGGSSLTAHNNGMPRTEVPIPIWNGTNPWAAEDKFHLIAFRFTINTASAGSIQVYVDPMTSSTAPDVSVTDVDNFRGGIADAIGWGRHWEGPSPVANGHAILTTSRLAYWPGNATLQDVIAHYPELIPAPSAVDETWVLYM